MESHTVTLQAVSALADNLGDTLVEGITEGNVRNHAALEVGPWPHTLGTVNDLVGDDKVTGLDSLLETADSGESNNATDADGAESSDVGAGRDLVRSDLVVGAMAAQERNSDKLVIVLAVVVEDSDRRRRLAPGG